MYKYSRPQPVNLSLCHTKLNWCICKITIRKRRFLAWYTRDYLLQIIILQIRQFNFVWQVYRHHISSILTHLSVLFKLEDLWKFGPSRHGHAATQSPFHNLRYTPLHAHARYTPLHAHAHSHISVCACSGVWCRLWKGHCVAARQCQLVQIGTICWKSN